MSHFLLDTGIYSLSAIWFPLVLWTWLSMVFWLCLTWSRKTVPAPGKSKLLSLLAAVMLSGLIGCSDIQSPSLHWSDRINPDQQFLTVEVPLEGYEITMDELDAFLNDWEDKETIIHLRVERNGYYINDKLMDVQSLLRKNNALRISYNSL